MSAVSLHLTGFGGETIADVLKDAAAVATRVGCWVTIDVNDVHVMIAPGDDPATLLENHNKAVEIGRRIITGKKDSV